MTPKTGYETPLVSVEFFPDTRMLAVGYRETVELLRVGDDELEKVHEVNGPRGIWGVSVSSDAKLLAAAGDDVHVWSLGGDAPTPRGVVPTAGLSADFSPDGQMLAVGGNHQSGELSLWDVSGGKPILQAKLPVPQGASDVEFSADGKRLAATTGYENVIRLWSVAGETPRHEADLKGHKWKAFSVAFSPDSSTLASASSDHTVRLWDLGDDSRERELAPGLMHHDGPVGRLAISTSGNWLLSTPSYTDFTMRLWDFSTGRVEASLAQEAGAFYYDSVVISADGKFAVTTNRPTLLPLPRVRSGRTAAVGRDAVAILWDIETRRIRAILPEHVGAIHATAFSPDGSLLATGGADQAIRLWDVAQGRFLKAIELGAGEIRALAFSADGASLIAVSDEAAHGLSYALNDDALNLQTVLEVKGGGSSTLSADGRLLAKVDENAESTQIHRIDDAGVTPVQTIRWARHRGYPRAFSPDGELLAMTSWGDDLPAASVWHVQSGERIVDWSLPGLMSDAIFTPDSRHLVTANHNGTIYVLRVPDR